MLEVEVKYRLDHRDPIVGMLRSWGATLVADHEEEDHYLRAPDRDFAKTDEAFRLRRIGERNLLTYKGPRHDAASKTRLECEVPCPDGDAARAGFLRLLGHLGYTPVAVVRKRRTILEFDRGGFTVHACLDDVERVGSFVEMEIVADEADRDGALAVVRAAAAELGLDRPEPRSYLEQLLGHAVRPGGDRPER